MSNAIFTPKTPHFFQPLLPGFHHHLSIPLSFFKYYLKGQNSERAVLRSRGRTWPVKIRDRRFEDGWEEFTRDHDLQVGDFLVFRHGGNMVFDVKVFDSSACQREYPLFAQEAKDQSRSKAKEPAKKFGKQHEKWTSTSFTRESPRFVVTLKPSFLKRSRLNIPKKFAKSNDLTDRNCEMTLVDQQGRSWMANLRHKNSDGQVYIGYGWRNICIANKLKENDCVLLELIGNGKKPTFKLHKVASDSGDKKGTNYPNSNAGSGCSKQAGHCKATQEVD